jgi:hypothetical protein
LPHVVVEMRAVVVCFDGGARRVVRVGVEGVEVRTDALHRGEVLSKISMYVNRLDVLERT